MFQNEQGKPATQACYDKCILQWHRCLKYSNPEVKKESQKQNGQLCEHVNLPYTVKCTCCIKAKATQTALPKSSQSKTTYLSFGNYPHWYLWNHGNHIPSRNKYMVTFTNDYSRYTHETEKWGLKNWDNLWQKPATNGKHKCFTLTRGKEKDTWESKWKNT